MKQYAHTISYSIHKELQEGTSICNRRSCSAFFLSCSSVSGSHCFLYTKGAHLYGTQTVVFHFEIAHSHLVMELWFIPPAFILGRILSSPSTRLVLSVRFRCSSCGHCTPFISSTECISILYLCYGFYINLWIV